MSQLCIAAGSGDCPVDYIFKNRDKFPSLHRSFAAVYSLLSGNQGDRLRLFPVQFPIPGPASGLQVCPRCKYALPVASRRNQI